MCFKTLLSLAFAGAYCAGFLDSGQFVLTDVGGHTVFIATA